MATFYCEGKLYCLRVCACQWPIQYGRSMGPSGESGTQPEKVNWLASLPISGRHISGGAVIKGPTFASELRYVVVVAISSNNRMLQVCAACHDSESSPCRGSACPAVISQQIGAEAEQSFERELLQGACVCQTGTPTMAWINTVTRMSQRADVT